MTYKLEDPNIVCLNECRISQENLKKHKIQDIFLKKYPYQFWNCSKPPARSSFNNII